MEDAIILIITHAFFFGIGYIVGIGRGANTVIQEQRKLWKDGKKR